MKINKSNNRKDNNREKVGHVGHVGHVGISFSFS